MLERLFSLFGFKEKNKTSPEVAEVKSYSTTLTSATEGADKEEELIPPLEKVYEKLRLRKEKITSEELNILIKYKYHKRELKSNYFTLNKDFITSTAFAIDSVNVIYKPDNVTVDDIQVTFKEILYNAKMKITISVEDMDEFIADFNIVKL